MTESLFWSKTVRPALMSFGKIERVEDLLKKGRPDVIYCLRYGDEPPRAGWIELKKRPRWPKDGWPVTLPHFTAEQVSELESWGRAGMGAFLLAQVADSYSLFDWPQVREVQEGVGRNRFVYLPLVHEDKKFPIAKVLHCLTSY